MTHNPRLLEISAWPWLERLSGAERRRVTLGDVPAADWDAIAGRRVDWVFLMGVWRRSAIGVELARSDVGLRAEYDRVLPGWTDADVAGSPYCIAAYEPDDRMGGWAGLDAARRELRARGIALMLDFVPNHTGFDHPWVAAHPERYVLGREDDYRAAPPDFRPARTAAGGTVYVACGRDPHFPPWRDVAQLNYFNSDTRSAMRDTLRAIAAHCDGVRCDMAMLALNDVFERTWQHVLRGEWYRPREEFWPIVTREIPGLTYLAEVYWSLEGALLEQGFHFAYDKRLLDCLHDSHAAGCVRRLLAVDAPPHERLARFIENHDEPRSAASLSAMLPAAASLAATIPGMRFFYDGQFEGRRLRAPVQLARWPDEPPDEAARVMYDRILAFAADSPVREGEWKLLSVSPAGDASFGDIVAYRWRDRTALAVIAINLNPHAAAQAHVPLLGELFPGEIFDFVDRLTGERYVRDRRSLEAAGLYVRLEAGSAHLFTVRAH